MTCTFKVRALIVRFSFKVWKILGWASGFYLLFYILNYRVWLYWRPSCVIFLDNSINEIFFKVQVAGWRVLGRVGLG